MQYRIQYALILLFIIFSSFPVCYADQGSIFPVSSAASQTATEGSFAAEYRYKYGYAVPQFGDLRYAITYSDRLDSKYFDFIKRAQINVLHWQGPFYAYDGLPARKKLPSIMRDLKYRINHVHKLGMKILFYIGPVFSYGDPIKRTQLFNFYDNEWETYSDYLGKKPDDPLSWVQRNSKGEPIKYAWQNYRGFYLCPNSHGNRQYISGVLKLIIEAGADGVFFDGPAFPRGGMCFCESCKKKFKAYLRNKYTASELKSIFGITSDIPIPDKNSGALWIEWKKFFADSLSDYLIVMRQFSQKRNPDFIVTANYWLREPYQSLAGTAENIALWRPAIDIAFSESDYNTGPYSEDGKKFSNSYYYRYLNAASHDKPVALLKTSVKASIPSGEFNLTKLCMAEAAANHGTWQLYGLGPYGKDAAIQYNEFFVNHVNLFRGWHNSNSIAVLNSVGQAYYGFTSDDAGISKSLTENLTPHDIITEEDIAARRIKNYRTLILPQVRVLSNGNIKYLKQYVYEGGNLIILGETGKYDIYGRLRPEGNLVSVFAHDKTVKTTKNTAKLQYGKGTVLFYQTLKLPTGMEEITDTGTKSSINIKDDIDRLFNAAISLKSSAGERIPSIEVNMMSSIAPNGLPQHALHLVNYDVDRAGNVKRHLNIKTAVRLPADQPCRQVTLYSPDLKETKQNLDYQITGSADDVTVHFTIPELRIYDIVVFNN